MNQRGAIILVTGLLTLADTTPACTAFLVAQGDTVLVGNNEDYFNPRTHVWFVPAEEGKLGRVYFGFDDFNPQGGMNERGLFFDGFTIAPRKVVRSIDKPAYVGQYQLAGAPIPGLIVTLVREANRLYLDVPRMTKFELSPESPTSFFYLTFGSLLKLTFLKDGQGLTVGFDGDLNGTKISAKRI